MNLFLNVNGQLLVSYLYKTNKPLEYDIKKKGEKRSYSRFNPSCHTWKMERFASAGRLLKYCPFLPSVKNC